MTLCAAGISNHNSKKRIVVICDRKLSFFGGSFAGDGMALKVVAIHQTWSVMFAGDTSSLVALVDALQSTVWKTTKNTIRDFARLCSKVYREERKKIIETNILSEYDIDTYQEYLDLRKTDSSLFEALTETISKTEEGWNLLFFGYDQDGEPHVFVISEYGKITFCDTEGFAAIGSGAWAAMVTLVSLHYSQSMPVEDAVYRILVSKFVAEKAADGVGEETFVAVLDGEQSFPKMLTIADELINDLREEWISRSVVPGGSLDQIGESLELSRKKPAKESLPEAAKKEAVGGTH
jgi:20S proteasome alpha/beta subunit